MKKIVRLGALLAVAPLTLVSAQDVFYEHFTYEPGLLTGAGTWTGEETPGSPRVLPGNLNYQGLAASIKNRLLLPSTKSKVPEVISPLETSVAAPFFSFLLKVDSPDGLNGSVPFGIFRLGTAGEKFAAGIYLKTTADGKAMELLASKRANPEKTSVAPTAIDAGRVHLIVGRYNTSVTPHELDLWINPESLGAEPSPEPSLTTSDGRDLPEPVCRILLGGGVGSPGVMIDEIRLGTTWEEVTPSH